MYKTKVTQATAILVNFMFYAGILACLASPWATKVYGYSGRAYWIQTSVILLSGIVSVYIMYQLKQMFKTVICANPFVMENANGLRKIAVASFLIAAV